MKVKTKRFLMALFIVFSEIKSIYDFGPILVDFSGCSVAYHCFSLSVGDRKGTFPRLSA